MNTGLTELPKEHLADGRMAISIVEEFGVFGIHRALLGDLVSMPSKQTELHANLLSSELSLKCTLVRVKNPRLESRSFGVFGTHRALLGYHAPHARP